MPSGRSKGRPERTARRTAVLANDAMAGRMERPAP